VKLPYRPHSSDNNSVDWCVFADRYYSVHPKHHLIMSRTSLTIQVSLSLLQSLYLRSLWGVDDTILERPACSKDAEEVERARHQTGIVLGATMRPAECV
jgi:hypothetical protein